MQGLIFTAEDAHNDILTTYSVYCTEDAQHKVHCEGAIYNLKKDDQGHYRFTDDNVPQWLKNKEEQITLKLQEQSIK